MKKQLMIIAALLFSISAFAQNDQKLGRRINRVDMTSINSNSVEFTITKKGDVLIVTAKGINSDAAKDCKNCNVSGKVIFVGGAEPLFKRGSKIVFPPNLFSAVRTCTLSADGSFSFRNAPKGICDFILGDIPIGRGWRIRDN